MARQTSIDAYRAIQDSKFVSAFKRKIYHALFNSGPLTQGEVWRLFLTGTARPSVTPRFAEMKAEGLIREVGERTCRVTGKTCYIWDVTDKIPTGRTARPNAKRILVETLEEIYKMAGEPRMLFDDFNDDRLSRIRHLSARVLFEVKREPK